MAGESLDELEEVGLGDLGDLDEGGMTKGVKAEPARAEGELGLALQPRRIDIGEDEAAGNRPFAGRAGMLEDVKVGLVEAKGAWQPHGSRYYTTQIGRASGRERGCQDMEISV